MLERRELLLQRCLSIVGSSVRAGVGRRWRRCRQTVLRTIQFQGIDKRTLWHRRGWSFSQVRSRVSILNPINRFSKLKKVEEKTAIKNFAIFFRNIRCGSLQCQLGNKQPVIGRMDQSYLRTFISIKGKEYECK